MESIKIQYTDPDTGLEKLDIVRFDIAKFRKDDSAEPTENIFFTSAATGVTAQTEIMGLSESMITANPANPYGCNVVYGLVKTKPTGSSIELTANPNKLGFVINEPVAVLADYDATTPIAIITPTGVTNTTLDFASTVSNSIKAGAVVVKMALPTPYVTAFKKADDSWGAKALLERPYAPVVDATPGQNSVAATITVSTRGKANVKKYLVYVISATNEADFDIQNPVIKANRKADIELDPPVSGTTVQGVATTFGGGTNYGGGSIANGTYYVIAVAKDGALDMGVNVSALSNIDTVVVSY